MKTEHILFEKRPAEYFTEAFPIGNGKLGGMVYGEPRRMRLGLNHDELWSGYEYDNTSSFDSSVYEKIEKLALKGEYLEAQRLYVDNFSKYESGAYLTLGDLIFELPEGEISDYRRELNIRESMTRVDFLLDGERVETEFFASFPSNVMAIRIKSQKRLNINVLPALTMINEIRSDDRVLLFEGECPKLSARQLTRHEQNPDLDKHGGVRFTAALSVRSDGEVTSNENGFSVSDGRETEIFLTVETSYKNGSECGELNFTEKAESTLSAALENSYDTIKAEHVADVTELFDRVEFCLAGEDLSFLPTSERIKRFAEGSGDNSLVALQFNMGRYYLIAASREGSRAMNLQGIWNDKMDPPWNSNYTVNINTEMNYWPALPCSMPELLEPLESLIRIIQKSGKKAARDLYGRGGMASNHNADIFGYVTPAGGRARWAHFPLSAGWLARELYNKYEYTLDKGYLESVYDILEDIAEFTLDSLRDDGEYLIITPGASPENVYMIGENECSLARSSTMFASIARESIRHYIAASNILGRESDLVRRARDAEPRLLPLRITNDGRIEEWYFGGESVSPIEKEPLHRHISHLYDLYPSNLINKNTPGLFAAAKESLRVRGDDSTGWSLGWKINCYARLGDGDGVMRLIRMFMRPIAPEVERKSKGGIYPNMFCAHPPFQIDGNLAFTAAMCEMLVGYDGDTPIPLPALPKEFPEGHMKGIALKGNKHADISWENGKIAEFRVY